MFYNITRLQILPLLIITSLFYSCSKYETVLSENDNKKGNVAVITNTNKEIFDLHQMTDVPEITLTVPLKDWNELLHNFDKNKDNGTKVVSNIDFNLNGTHIIKDSIGLRLKGNTSRTRPEGFFGMDHDPKNPDWHHCHFGLDFNKFIEGQKLNGLKALNLKWFANDPTYARNIYCYDLFEKFGVWTAPQASYCKLTIYVEGDQQPAYYGVYAMVESVDDDYLDKRKQHWSSNGNLWKAIWGANFNDNNTIGIENQDPEGQNSQIYQYDLKTNKTELASSKAELNDFIYNLNSREGSDFENWIDSKMDVSLFLKTYAVNVIVGNWDDYWVNQNNYYFYFDSNGKAYFIPFDYDNTLGTSPNDNIYVYDSGTNDPLEWGTTDKKERPLINKILAITKYKEEYKGYIKELIDPNKDLFYTDHSIQRLQTWKKLIDNDTRNDTGQDMTIKDEPASWVYFDKYKLFTGDDLGKESPGTPNFFKTKIKSIYW